MTDLNLSDVAIGFLVENMYISAKRLSYTY